MHTIEVVNSIKQISALLDDVLDSWKGFYDVSVRQGGAKDPLGGIGELVRFSNSFSVVMSTLRASPVFSTILRSFKFDKWLDPDFPSILVQDYMGGRGGVSGGLIDFQRETTRFKWLTAAADAIAELTSPPEVRSPEPSDEIATILIQHDEARPLPVEIMASAMSHFSELYQLIAQVNDIKGAGKLVVINVDGGSSIRFDLKGLGEAVKETKRLIIEVFEKLRRFKIDRVVDHTDALMDSLAKVAIINQLERDGKLEPEQAQLFRRGIVEHSRKFLETGARIAEIQPQETFDNQKLLQEYQQKLLPAPAGETEGGKALRPKKARKRKSAE